jgi:hypothetical protein
LMSRWIRPDSCAASRAAAGHGGADDRVDYLRKFPDR